MLPRLSFTVANALAALAAALKLVVVPAEVVVAEAAEPAVADLRAESPEAE